MKSIRNVFSLLLLALAFSFFAAPEANAQRFFDMQSAASDALVNQDTLIYTTTPSLIDVPYYYSIYVQADSVSGANAGFAYLQVSNDRAGSVWVTTQTLTIDGTGTDSALYEGILYARRVRVYCISPSGTRNVAIKVNSSFKRLNN
jgi:hypothetical protein